MKKANIRVATDVGGTFTDLVCFELIQRQANIPWLLQNLIQHRLILRQAF